MTGRSCRRYFRAIIRLSLGLVVIVVIALVIDTSLVKISVLVTSESGSVTRINSFIVIVSVTIIIELVILAFIKNQTIQIRGKKIYIDTLHKVTTILQVTIVGIVILVALQVILVHNISPEPSLQY